MADPRVQALEVIVRNLEPCQRLEMAIRLIKGAPELDRGEARSALVLAAALAFTVHDEITTLDAAGMLGPHA
jgi:hypothetical protein